MDEKILIVEDDAGISDFLNLELKHENYQTLIAHNGREALELFKSYNPNLILLDIMLPELNGMEVLRRIRNESNVPVIIITARGESFNKINGLDLGADDYIPKPFLIEELLARIRALLRRVNFDSSKNNTILKNGNVEINLNTTKVTIKGKEIDFSKTEFFLLKLFMENKNHVLNRDSLIDQVWGKDHCINSNTIDVYVGYLRTKIDNVLKTEYIRTVRGLGFMMVDKDENI